MAELSSGASLDFDLKALYDALDEQRRARAMSWAAVARQISRFRKGGCLNAVSTITRLKTGTVAEGDGVLQMLLWLGRSPESFVPGLQEADAECFHLQDTGEEQILRWDTRALYAALNAERDARGITWKEVAREIGGWTPSMLAHLAKGGRASFPGVMRVVRWLRRPATAFTRVSDS